MDPMAPYLVRMCWLAVLALAAACPVAQAVSPATARVQGELKQWHRVTLTFDGPATSEDATPNPFRNYRLNVTFRHAQIGRAHV